MPDINELKDLYTNLNGGNAAATAEGINKYLAGKQGTVRLGDLRQENPALYSALFMMRDLYLSHGGIRPMGTWSNASSLSRGMNDDTVLYVNAIKNEMKTFREFNDKMLHHENKAGSYLLSYSDQINERMLEIIFWQHAIDRGYTQEQTNGAWAGRGFTTPQPQPSVNANASVESQQNTNSPISIANFDNLDLSPNNNLGDINRADLLSTYKTIAAQPTSFGSSSVFYNDSKGKKSVTNQLMTDLLIKAQKVEDFGYTDEQIIKIMQDAGPDKKKNGIALINAYQTSRNLPPLDNWNTSTPQGKGLMATLLRDAMWYDYQSVNGPARADTNPYKSEEVNEILSLLGARVDDSDWHRLNLPKGATTMPKTTQPKTERDPFQKPENTNPANTNSAGSGNNTQKSNNNAAGSVSVPTSAADLSEKGRMSKLRIALFNAGAYGPGVTSVPPGRWNETDDKAFADYAKSQNITIASASGTATWQEHAEIAAALNANKKMDDTVANNNTTRQNKPENTVAGNSGAGIAPGAIPVSNTTKTTGLTQDQVQKAYAELEKTNPAMAQIFLIMMQQNRELRAQNQQLAAYIGQLSGKNVAFDDEGKLQVGDTPRTTNVGYQQTAPATQQPQRVSRQSAEDNVRAKANQAATTVFNKFAESHGSGGGFNPLSVITGVFGLGRYSSSSSNRESNLSLDVKDLEKILAEVYPGENFDAIRARARDLIGTESTRGIDKDVDLGKKGKRIELGEFQAFVNERVLAGDAEWIAFLDKQSGNGVGNAVANLQRFGNQDEIIVNPSSNTQTATSDVVTTVAKDYSRTENINQQQPVPNISGRQQAPDDRQKIINNVASDYGLQPVATTPAPTPKPRELGVAGSNDVQNNTRTADIRPNAQARATYSTAELREKSEGKTVTPNSTTATTNGTKLVDANGKPITAAQFKAMTGEDVLPMVTPNAINRDRVVNTENTASAFTTLKLGDGKATNQYELTKSAQHLLAAVGDDDARKALVGVNKNGKRAGFDGEFGPRTEKALSEVFAGTKQIDADTWKRLATLANTLGEQKLRENLTEYYKENIFVNTYKTREKDIAARVDVIVKEVQDTANAILKPTNTVPQRDIKAEQQQAYQAAINNRGMAQYARDLVVLGVLDEKVLKKTSGEVEKETKEAITAFSNYPKNATSINAALAALTAQIGDKASADLAALNVIQQQAETARAAEQAKLEELKRQPDPKDDPRFNRNDPEEVRQLVVALNASGIDVKQPQDGKFEGKVATAVKEYNAVHGIGGGDVSKETLNQLIATTEMKAVKQKFDGNPEIKDAKKNGKTNEVEANAIAAFAKANGYNITGSELLAKAEDKKDGKVQSVRDHKFEELLQKDGKLQESLSSIADISGLTSTAPMKKTGNGIGAGGGVK